MRRIADLRVFALAAFVISLTGCAGRIESGSNDASVSLVENSLYADDEKSTAKAEAYCKDHGKEHAYLTNKYTTDNFLKNYTHYQYRCQDSPEAIQAKQQEAAEERATAEQQRKAAQKQYDVASSLFKNGKYEKAEDAFQKYLSDYPYGKYWHEATYWHAEALYAQRKYGDALTAYNRSRQANYKNVMEAKSQLGTALSHANLSLNEDACHDLDMFTANLNAYTETSSRAGNLWKQLDCEIILDPNKKQCKSFGFKPRTDAFVQCVLNLQLQAKVDAQRADEQAALQQQQAIAQQQADQQQAQTQEQAKKACRLRMAQAELTPARSGAEALGNMLGAMSTCP